MGIFSSLFGQRTKKPAVTFAISKKEVMVRGWKDAQLNQIIEQFKRPYRDQPSQIFSTKVETIGNGLLKVTFPSDIKPEIFCFLINYAQYPENFDLESRTILVTGKAIIDSDFLPSEQSLIGKRILFYIPADDSEYDVVFAQVDGKSYSYPFSSVGWQAVEEPRFPAGIEELR